jgi:signal transduction histidine kinase
VIGELTGNIAHQWRQPLNALGAIIANVEAKITYDHLSNEELMKSCQLSTSVLKHLSGTINTLQDFFVDQSETKEDFDINEQLTLLIQFLHDSMANQHITINFTPQKTLFIHGNKNLLSQVIMNILLNAKDILIERTTEKDKFISITTKVEDNKIIITITDNGGGIKIKPIEKIFELFVSNKTNGSGIGLYLSKNIVEKLGGTLNVSNTHEGAQFTLSLPIS